MHLTVWLLFALYLSPLLLPLLVHHRHSVHVWPASYLLFLLVSRIPWRLRRHCPF